jgi:hypothetical protein
LIFCRYLCIFCVDKCDRISARLPCIQFKNVRRVITKLDLRSSCNLNPIHKIHSSSLLGPLAPLRKGFSYKIDPKCAKTAFCGYVFQRLRWREKAFQHFLGETPRPPPKASHLRCLPSTTRASPSAPHSRIIRDTALHRHHSRHLFPHRSRCVPPKTPELPHVVPEVT